MHADECERRPHRLDLLITSLCIGIRNRPSPELASLTAATAELANNQVAQFRGQLHVTTSSNIQTDNAYCTSIFQSTVRPLF